MGAIVQQRRPVPVGLSASSASAKVRRARLAAGTSAARVASYNALAARPTATRYSPAAIAMATAAA